MRYTIVGQGLDGGIAADNLGKALGGRVAQIGGVDIGGKPAAQLRQTRYQLHSLVLGLTPQNRHGIIGARCAEHVTYLLFEQVVQLFDSDTDMEA